MLDTILRSRTGITAFWPKVFQRIILKSILARVENLKSTRAGVEVAFSKEGNRKQSKLIWP